MKDINLLLEEDKKIPQGEAVKVKPLKAAGKIVLTVIIAAAAATTIVVPMLYSKALEMQLTSVKEQIQDEKYQEVVSVKSQLSDVEQQLENKKGIIAHIDEQAYPVNNILNIVKNNTPEGCEIKDIQYEANAVRVSVNAQQITNIAEFLLNMDRLENIRLSDNSNTIKINTNGDYVFNFDVGQKEAE